jgi:hypothetical protein
MVNMEREQKVTKQREVGNVRTYQVEWEGHDDSHQREHDGRETVDLW